MWKFNFKIVVQILKKLFSISILYVAFSVLPAQATLKVDINRRKIQLAEPIKKLGESVVAIKLHPKVTAQLTVRVVKDEQVDNPEGTPS